MYTLSVPYTNYKGTSSRKSVTFNLDGHEVFRMLPELKKVFDWMESNKTQELRELDVYEVREFYTDFEAIILEAYGEMSEDGEHFRKEGKYDFESSALFNACMIMFVTKPEETVKLLEGMMPMELFKAVQNADAGQLAQATEAKVTVQEAEIARLRAELDAKQA